MSVDYYIGIDGGGSKTEAVLINQNREVLSRALTGATNPNDVGVEISAQRICALVTQLLQNTGISPHQVCLFAGISGALNHKETLLLAICGKLPHMSHIEVDSDIACLMYAELPPGDGACVICGTGSACFLRIDGEMHRIGGWGYLLDSAGSGYDMGRMALEAALKAYDGRGQTTRLTQLLEGYLGAPVQASLTAIYEKGKPYIAACAPLVFEAARAGDGVAEQILRVNAQAVADMIQTACQKRQAMRGGANKSPLLVAMGGSINQKEVPMWTSLVATLCPAEAELMVADTPMVVGAVMKAYLHHHPNLSQEAYLAQRQTIKQGYKAYTQITCS